jgi:hypothetical protein
MRTSMNTVLAARTHLSAWERVLLILPAWAGLFAGFFLLFLPAWFAVLLQFPVKNLYIFQLAGAAILGYGIALSIGLFQRAWLPLRLPLVGVLVLSLASCYVCVLVLLEGPVSLAACLGLSFSALSATIAGLLLVRHRRSSRQPLLRARGIFRALLIIGGISATIFGCVPLFLPDVFVPLFHLQAGTEAIAREAGAACLGYAALSLLVQQGVERQELALIAVMAGVFNGASGIVSLLVLPAGTVFLLPWIIVPVGLTTLVISIFVLRAGLLPDSARNGSLPATPLSGGVHASQK